MQSSNNHFILSKKFEPFELDKFIFASKLGISPKIIKIVDQNNVIFEKCTEIHNIKPFYFNIYDLLLKGVQNGLIHCDGGRLGQINLMLDQNGHPKLIDWGENCDYELENYKNNYTNPYEFALDLLVKHWIFSPRVNIETKNHTDIYNMLKLYI